MSLRRFCIAGTIAFLVLTPGACASRSAGTADAGPATEGTATDAQNIRVEVNHNRADGGIATIYIEPVAGSRQTLGTIAPGERKTFYYHVQAQNRSVRLSAINSTGQTLTTGQTTVPRGAALEWDLHINSLRVKR